MERIKVWRDTFGPGASASGARFRSEVCVCSSCRSVTQTARLPQSSPCYRPTVQGRDIWGNLKILEQCLAPRFFPTQELGYYYLEGRSL